MYFCSEMDSLGSQRPSQRAQNKHLAVGGITDLKSECFKLTPSQVCQLKEFAKERWTWDLFQGTAVPGRRHTSLSSVLQNVGHWNQPKLQQTLAVYWQVTYCASHCTHSNRCQESVAAGGKKNDGEIIPNCTLLGFIIDRGSTGFCLELVIWLFKKVRKILQALYWRIFFIAIVSSVKFIPSWFEHVFQFILESFLFS